jgi:hypothetical protein
LIDYDIIMYFMLLCQGRLIAFSRSENVWLAHGQNLSAVRRGLQLFTTRSDHFKSELKNFHKKCVTYATLIHYVMIIQMS